MKVVNAILIFSLMSVLMFKQGCCASISKIPDKEESSQLSRNYADFLNRRTENFSPFSLDKRYSTQQITNMKSNSYQLAALKKLMEHILVGKRARSEESKMNARDNQMMTKQRSPLLRGFALFVVDLGSEPNDEIGNGFTLDDVENANLQR